MIIVQKSAEIKLMEMLGSVREPSGWLAIHFHLSDLLEQYKSDYQVKIAINLIHDMLKGYEGGIFQMIDNGIIVLCNELEKNVQSKLVFQLRYLYMDDPLAYNDNGEENPKFATIYDLRVDWQPFMDLCGRRMSVMVRKSSAPEKPVRETAAAPAPEKPEAVEAPKAAAVKGDFSVSRLASIERDLDHADLQKVLRKQPVCAVLPDMTMRRVFDEVYINIAHLRQLLRMDVDFLSNRWLFKYLTQILDQRVLELIRSSPSRYVDSPVSLNLNVETLISKAFTDFDAQIKPSAKVGIVIEIPVVDVFADMAAFTLARNEVQRLGYRVCLDGVSSASFMMIDREKLGVDLVKVQWNADAESDLASAENIALSKAISSVGANRVILCRCDNKQAVQYGQALGISLFQGRYIDKVLNPNAKIEN